MNIKEVIIFDGCFVPTIDFADYCIKKGYRAIDFIGVSSMCFDPDIIQYVKEHSDWHAWGKAKYSMRGAKSTKFRIGFAGAATIIEVDIDRKWNIRYSNGGVPYPVYISFETNDFNYTTINFKKEENGIK